MKRKNRLWSDQADDFLVVMRSTLLCHQRERGSVVAGGNKMYPLSHSAAEVIRRDYLSRPTLKGFNVWVIHRDDY